MNVIAVQLPDDFASEHEQAVIDYLAGNLNKRQAWQTAFQAFDLLDDAALIAEDGHYTFRTLYLKLVDRRFADEYIGKLLELEQVKEESPVLWSHYARKIVAECQQQNWLQADFPDIRLLLSYLLYWWGAFARGYAFEVEIFRDLKQSGINFQAHNLLDRQARYSPGDLIVQGMIGDIKTSVYFVQVARPLQHDFYIVRLLVRGKSQTLAVMLQPEAWHKINGDTVSGTMASIVTQFPHPVRIKQGIHDLVALDYDQWKKHVLRLQRGD